MGLLMVRIALLRNYMLQGGLCGGSADQFASLWRGTSFIYLTLCSFRHWAKTAITLRKLSWCSVATSNRDNKALMKIKLKDRFLTTAECVGEINILTLKSFFSVGKQGSLGLSVHHLWHALKLPHSDKPRKTMEIKALKPDVNQVWLGSKTYLGKVGSSEQTNRYKSKTRSN